MNMHVRNGECQKLKLTKNRLLTNSNLDVYLCFDIAVYPSVEPGWLQATYEGKTGLIPENYVAFL